MVNVDVSSLSGKMYFISILQQNIQSAKYNAVASGVEICR